MQHRIHALSLRKAFQRILLVAEPFASTGWQTTRTPHTGVDFVAAGEGRRPGGLRELVSHFHNVASYWANAAVMEGVAVPAFEQLVVDLQAHGAPPALIKGARLAIRDEERHASTATRMARALGVEPVVPEVPLLPPRSVLELARENAREGCVGETYAALQAAWQAQHARDPAVRTLMTSLARDESKHAAVSWAVHAWAMEQLNQDVKANVAQEMALAWQDLEALAQDAPPRELVELLGLPNPGAAKALVQGLKETLWQA